MGKKIYHVDLREEEREQLTAIILDTRFPTKEALNVQVRAWAKNRNNKQKGVDWQFKTKDAIIKLKRLYPTILD
jgi:hypothetical protein